MVNEWITMAVAARLGQTEKKTEGGDMRRVLVAGVVALMFGAAAQAQPYPSRPITMVVPFAAGGPTDAIARAISERMRVSLGQSIIIENVTGAGGSIGVGRARAGAGRHNQSLRDHGREAACRRTGHPDRGRSRAAGLPDLAMVGAVGAEGDAEGHCREAQRRRDGCARRSGGAPAARRCR